MKSFLKLLALLLFAGSFAQTGSKKPEPAVFVDSIFMTFNTLKYLNLDPNDIKNFEVKKEDITINNKVYHGQIYVTTNSLKKYEFISLFEVKRNFTKSKSNKAIFVIDGEIIQDKPETYQLDKNNILSVSVMDAENSESLMHQKKQTNSYTRG